MREILEMRENEEIDGEKLNILRSILRRSIKKATLTFVEWLRCAHRIY